MSLAADELRAYTRDIEEEACSVGCIKQDFAGYWTTCAFTPEGGSGWNTVARRTAMGIVGRVWRGQGTGFCLPLSILLWVLLSRT